MFVGEFRHSLDEKSRIVLPSKFRSQLSNTIYVTLELSNCLGIYSEEEFSKLASKYTNLDDFDKLSRAVKNVFFANSSELSLDKQGRISIPKNLLEKVGINKEIVLTGEFNHINVYSKEVFENNMKEDEANFATNAQQIFSKSHM